jgi:hypothetical protein
MAAVLNTRCVIMKKLVAVVVVASSMGGCAEEANDDVATTQATHPIMAGAGYTTFDTNLGGCTNGGPNPNGVNCNGYLGKDYVYMSGGPAQLVSGLADGSYYFTVLAPGAQNGGFIDGAAGNLSSPYDTAANRTFTTTNHQISAYAGTHAQGTSPAPASRPILGLAPFADTPNPGGVYILAICQSGATSASQCKYDAFRVREGDPGGDPDPQFPVIGGGKYYDANLNGRWDTGETGIAGWPIDYHDGVSGTFITGADGLFAQTMIADTYYVAERLPSDGFTWHQTGNTVDQTTTDGPATATLLGDKTYTVTVADDSNAFGLFFGNVCIGSGGGHTLGYWSNKNGQSLIDSGDLAALTALSLRNATGAAFDPTKASQVRTWLLNGTATNMSYMLSVQMAATVLNIRNHLVASGSVVVYAPGTDSASALGFATLDQLIAEAEALLAANPVIGASSPLRTRAEAVKDAFDYANNNWNYLQASAATCSAPVF